MLAEWEAEEDSIISQKRKSWENLAGERDIGQRRRWVGKWIAK